MPITPTEKIWMNGQLVDWADAKIHILTHTLHYGTGVFEGIRAYETARRPGRLPPHRPHPRGCTTRRKILMMAMPYSVEELVAGGKETVRADGSAVVLRPADRLLRLRRDGVSTRCRCTVDVAIACWPWGAYLGEEALLKGARMKISSWTRHDHNTMPPAAKTDGQLRELVAGQGRGAQGRLRRGDHAQPAGLRVASAPARTSSSPARAGCITPPLAAGALEGITQDSVMTIARDLGFDVRVDHLARSDLYIAEEIFVCGTAAEVTPVSSVDDRAVPVPGPDDEGDHGGVRQGRPRPGRPLQGLGRACLSRTAQ